MSLVKSPNVYEYDTDIADTTTPDSGTTETDPYTYNEDGSVATFTDEDNVVYTYAYYADGNLKSVTGTNGYSEYYEYNSNGDCTLERFVEDGVTTTYTYTYDSLFNLLTVSKNGEAIEEYSYLHRDYNGDGIIDQSLIYTEELEDGTSNTYMYFSGTSKVGRQIYSKDGSTLAYNYDSKGRLSSVEHNGFTYNYTYAPFGNTATVKVGNQTLVTNTFNSATGTINSVTYGNASAETYSYNAYGEPQEKTLAGVGKYEYKYDSHGRLIYEIDRVSTQKTYYHYDEKGRLYGETVSSIANTNAFDNVLYNDVNAFGSDGLVAKNTLDAGDKTYNTLYTYNEDGNPASTDFTNSRAVNYTYDSGGMLTGKTTTTTTPIAETFTYNDDGYIATHAIGSDVYSYTYDYNGNITEIKKNNVSQQSYVYDAKNQLTRENNLDINKTIVYTYDSAGNILNKKEYAYTTGDVGTVSDTASYTYDSTWKDKLTSYDGQSISYDSIGNPTSYRGVAMSWFGRRMQSYSKNGTSVTYSYDSDGLRTQKIVNGVAHDYYYVDGLLRFEKHGDEYALNYRYDQNGNLVAISRNVNGTSSMVYVVTNSRGDVIELRTGTGALSAKYTYDSWGKVVSVTNANGEAMASNSIAMLNSVRYRGYVYDSETGLYYLQSRYYDPEVGRLINATLNKKEFLIMKIRKILVIILFIAVSVFVLSGLVTGFLKPFPSMLSQDNFFEDWSSEQEYTKDYALTIQKAPDKDFVVLNLTDIQLSDNEVYGRKAKKAKAMIKELVEKTEPDLITLTGDNAWGVLAYIQHAEYIDSLGIPWAPVMGNHDGEKTFSEFWASYFYENAENCLWNYGPKGMGFGNYIINIEENGKVIHTMFMMDTHSKVEEKDEYGHNYDHLWDNQIEWYKWAVKGIEKTEGNKVESSAFMHIPVYELKTVWAEYYDKEKDCFTGPYAEGSFGVIHETPCSGAVNNNFMDDVIGLSSTKNMFFGHDHVNNASFLYEGVRLTYGLKLGEGCYFEEGLEGGTTFTIGSNGSGIVEHIYIQEK